MPDSAASGSGYLGLVEFAGDGCPALADGVGGDDPTADAFIQHPESAGWFAAGPASTLRWAMPSLVRALMSSRSCWAAEARTLAVNRPSGSTRSSAGDSRTRPHPLRPARSSRPAKSATDREIRSSRMAIRVSASLPV